MSFFRIGLLVSLGLDFWFRQDWISVYFIVLDSSKVYEPG